MHNNISINYKIMTVFASDIAIYRRMSHDEYYDCRSEQTTCLKEDLSDYEGYLYIDNKKFPYADRFIESFFYLYGISGMSDKTSVLREQYLQHLIDSNPSKRIRLLLFDEVCIYAGQDIVKPVIDKIYRRFMRRYPKAVLKIIYDNFKAIITCSCVENNIIYVLDIRYDMLRGEFLAYG
jgi:hypothetical protein